MQSSRGWRERVCFRFSCPPDFRLNRISAAAGFAYEALAHEHFQKGLIANALAFRDLAGLCEISFRQADRDLHATLLIQLRNQTRSPGLGSLGFTLSGFLL